MARTTKKKKSKKSAPAFSPRTRNTLFIAVASVAVIAGGWWVYIKVTTIPPPELTQATPEQVAGYLGNNRGFARLSIPKREEFLANTFSQMKTYDDRLALNRALRRMSRQEQEVVLNATLDVVQVRVMELAEEYDRQPTRRAKAVFVDKAIQSFKKTQANLGGGGNPNLNVGEPFKPFMPQSSEHWQKMLVTRTTPSERAKAQPLLEAIVQKEKQMGNTRRVTN